MIIERKEDGNLSAYCFRCCRRGWDTPVRHFKSHGKDHEDDVCSTARLVKLLPPSDASDEWGRYPREVKEWLLRGGVTPVINSAMGFSWSDRQSKLWIEARQYSKITTGWKLSGYIVRGFSPKSYLTRTDDKENFYGYYVTDNVINNSKVVIVEDVVSAIKCSQVVDSIAIFGVHPKDATIQHILSSGYKEAYIFLDADNPQVRMKAREIPKRLPFIKCHIIETGSDPKYLSKEKIEDLIR